MKFIRSAAAALLFASGAALAPAPAAAQGCPIDRPIVFGDLDWDSAVFHNDVARFILEKGYGCKTDSIPGTTVPLYAGTVRGDIDVIMEIWSNTSPEVWTKGLADDKVREVGVNFPDAYQNWFVPRYLVEGDDAPAKGLKSVADLPKFKALFTDPEEPSKGRFYNCISGWACEMVNTKKFHAYGLDKDFVNFRPGTGAALIAAVEGSIKRKKPIVFHYWGPTWLLGKLGDQVVALEEPAYDDAAWQQLMDAKSPEEVKKATAYPQISVKIGLNAGLADKAGDLVAFLKNYKTTSALVSEALAYAQDHDGSMETAAHHFLETRQDLWTKWVPDDVAKRVKAAL
ncbi:ABC transporter substrate-binding protein [Chelatococcus sp. GCM10030263]|uniref:ABC transporter substrate-binding protein n=1 Tax=Chelatococcus sp. GCM10030263 TaxID=3273387 RepID=UPI00361305D9